MRVSDEECHAITRDSMNVTMRRPTIVGIVKQPALLVALSIVCGVVAVETLPQTPPRDAPRPAQASTARVRGRIFALETGQPLGRALVTLSGAALSPPRRTLTDGEGRYEFTDVPLGSFTLIASKTGYTTLQYGQRRPFEPGRQVTVSGASVVERVDVTLPRGAVIAVRLTDDLGFPVAGVEVSAHRYQYRANGERSLATIYGNPPGPTTTDDRGELRLFGLMPGEYVVSAVSRFTGASSGTVNATSEGYAPTYYPGVITPGQATPVSVRVGEETPIQFSLARSRLARVSGIVVDPQGRPANGARVSLSTQTPTFPASATIGVDGTFGIGELPPGEYTLVVTFDTYEQIGPTLTITGSDVSDLRIAVGQGTRVSGRLVFEGGVPPKGAPPPFRIALTPIRSVAPGILGSRTTVPDEENRFGFTGITGRVIVSASSPDGWMTKSVVVDGQDFTHSPLDVRDRATVSNVVITLTNRMTTLRGQVIDGRAQPVGDYVVVVVPAETYEPPIMNQRVRALRPGADTTFTTRGMMPGRYMAVAVAALEDGRQFAPEFQQQVRRLGQEFSMREGEAATLNLRLAPDL